MILKKSRERVLASRWVLSFEFVRPILRNRSYRITSSKMAKKRRSDDIF